MSDFPVNANDATIEKRDCTQPIESEALILIREAVRFEINAFLDKQRSATPRRHWTPDDLAAYLALEDVKWVYERTRKASDDFIPHYKLGKYIRFDPQDPDFIDWLKRHKRIKAIDNHGTG